MTIKFNIFHKGNFRIFKATKPPSPNHAASLDLCEEYASAFRTESYVEFWARVLDLTAEDVPMYGSMESTAATRLPSYRLFAEQLLNPDQPSVTKTLALAKPKNRSENHSLLSDFFSKTADAFILCGRLLKDIEQIRLKYRPIKTALESILHSSENHFPTAIADRLTNISNAHNPFNSSAPSPHLFRVVQAACTSMLTQLESRRKKTQAKLRLINGLKHGLAIVLVAVTAAVAVVAVFAASHVLIMVFVSVPALVPASARRLIWVSAQLDAAAKGTYILNKDLETIGRLVDRVDDELEHARTMLQFCLEKRMERIQITQELLHELKKNNSSFIEQLDELEEHLYLCSMTINRARSLVIKEVMELSSM